MEYVLLTVVLAAASIFDGKDNRIPNSLCLAALIPGILLRAERGGVGSIFTAVLLALFLFAVLFPFWSFRILGAGDVKLIMVSGVFLGENIIPFLACSGGCTAVYSLWLMIRRRNFFRRMEVFILYLRDCFLERRILLYPFDCSREWEEGGIKVSYGLLAGHILALALGLYGGM